MRIWRLIQLIVLSVLIISAMNSSAISDTVVGYNTALVTRIVSIDDNTPDQQSDVNEFKFLIMAEVWNQYEYPITISHPNNCGFTIEISSLETNPEPALYNDHICGDAITEETFDPGVTKTGLSVVFVLSDSSNKIPDGDYALTYGSPSIGMYDELVSFIKTTMTVTNGMMVVQGDPISTEWGTTIPGPITISSDTLSENIASTNYIATTSEVGTTTTNFVSDVFDNKTKSSEGKESRNAAIPEAVSETLDFNLFWSIMSLNIVVLTMINKRKRN